MEKAFKKQKREIRKMNTKHEHEEIVKKTVFEKLDTVNKLKPKQIDGLIKLNSLFSPSFAFSDTQLIDNKGLRQLYFQKTSFKNCCMLDAQHINCLLC